jgi:hypothetical protein
MKILLDLPDHKAPDFIALIKALGYVNLTQDQEISESQKYESLKRLQMLENGTMQRNSWEEFEKEINS